MTYGDTTTGITRLTRLAPGNYVLVCDVCHTRRGFQALRRHALDTLHAHRDIDARHRSRNR